MALPLATAGSLTPAFAPARPVSLAVKLPCCVCTLRTISTRTEGTFARLRYILGGDRPSQTTRLTLFTARIHGAVLENRNTKGGISRVAPRQPQPALQSLPPILNEVSQSPISSCSKGSRGLSVWPRVLGIFTEIAISPSPSLRQRPTRYAIRAGRNLPDKEFRYLRTVIVTAAVYRGLVSVLRRPEGRLTPPRNLPAPGRRQPLYVVLRLSRDLCFW